MTVLAAAWLLLGGMAQERLTITLEQAREKALEQHPALAAVELTARAAAETPKQVQAALAPQVTVGITGSVADETTRLAFSGLNSPLLISRLGTGVQLNQQLTDFGRTRQLAQAATLQADARKQMVGATRLAILMAVDRAYYGILRARELTRVAEETVKARQVVVEQVEALTRSEIRSVLDLSFAKVNLADAQIQLNRSRNELEAAEADLSLALGMNTTVHFDLVDRPIQELLPPEAEALVAKAVATRPELRQLSLELQAAEKQLTAEKLASRPAVTLQGVVGALPLAQGPFLNRYGAVGVSVAVPVLNGRLFASRQAEVALRARSLQKQREDRANQISRDVRNAFLNARNAYDRLALTREFLEQSGRALELAQTRYELGLGTIVELSQAQLNQTAAQVSAASARYEYQILRSILRYQLSEDPL